MEGIAPLSQQRHSLSTSSVQTSPGVPASPVVSPPTPQTPATPPVVVGYNNNCPPGLYVFKDKVCPYHAQGCQYRTHIQNLLTRHVIRMHDPNFRQEHRRTTRAPRTNPPADEPDEEEEFGHVPPPELSPGSIRRRREPATTGQENASFGSPNSTLSVPSPFVHHVVFRFLLYQPLFLQDNRISPVQPVMHSSIKGHLPPAITGPHHLYKA